MPFPPLCEEMQGSTARPSPLFSGGRGGGRHSGPQTALAFAIIAGDGRASARQSLGVAVSNGSNGAHAGLQRRDSFDEIFTSGPEVSV